MLRCLGLLYPGLEKEQPKHLDLLKSFQNINHWVLSELIVRWANDLSPMIFQLHILLCPRMVLCWASKHHFCPGPEATNREKSEKFVLVSFTGKLA